MGSAAGLSEAKILALAEYATSDLYEESERAALAYADAITLSEQDVSDALFAQLREHFAEEAIIELTASIAWENASSKFNRALRIEAQDLWERTRSM